MPGFPDSIRGQLVLLIVAALAVAQAISLWLFVDERSLAVRAALGSEAAARAANVARLIEEAPEPLHEAILRAADSPLVRFGIAGRPEVDHRDHRGTGAVEARIRALLGDRERDIRVELHEVVGSVMPLPHMSSDMAQMHLAMMEGQLAAIEMRLSIALSDGRWLNVATRFQRPPLQWAWASALSFGLTAALLLIAAFWFILTRITRPLKHLSRAADRLGRGEATAAIEPAGPSEIRDLACAFNRMQERLSRFIGDRTRLIAALSHDLRSPLTAMRVRAEMIDDAESREKLVVSIEEMQEMVDGTLAFARGMATSEPTERADIAAFLATLRDDMAAGFGIEAEPGLIARIRPKSMRRALRNVIENGLRYGGEVEVAVKRTGEMIELCVRDRGPGIPEAEQERVFEPFYRIEKSRSRDTGGAGLGLAIARTIIHGHGGSIELANRTGGGLEVRIRLPADTG
ncbi:Osmolarity sensor protein EnvZ [Defluviimonas aquaemixtae]|uniref:histidine kinase n=1 Tax=Albidovulum aquaemixtae TaxID=1542388 RepID=A0A2R8B6J4_9RHOB|nr:ATP-binding protein [Defluviimonas aquaemixtae]SPH18258.1 Osmolarity sensor protein EnvZ [Defluviimonas aquaemixtae]